MLETQIVISDSNARKYGLEAAVVLSVLNNLELADLSEDEWTEVQKVEINNGLQFLDNKKIRTAMSALVKLEALEILSNQCHYDSTFKFRLVRHKPATQTCTEGVKESISVNWSPSPETVQLIASRSQLSTFEITQLAQVFISECVLRGAHARQFESKFISFCHQKKLTLNNGLFSRDSGKQAPIPSDWIPNSQVVGVLLDKGIKQELIDTAIPEFVLYWSERGTACETWGTKFVSWMVNKSNSGSELFGPLVIPSDWIPSVEIYKILGDENIDQIFAESLSKEFRLYWSESGIPRHSWNSTFLMHAREKWAGRAVSSKNAGFSSDAFSDVWALDSMDDVTDNETVVSTQ